MSASTSSKTGSAAVSAGGRRPDWCSSAARPSVFSATVLPPVFGPLMTSARRSPRSRSIGTAVPGSSSGCRASTRRTSSETRTGAPRQRRESVPHATARSIAPVASTSAVSASARSPTATDSSRRIRSTSSRSSAIASDWRLESSTTSNGSTKSVCPEPEASWTIPFTLERELALTASTGRPPRMATKSSCRCSARLGERASRRSSSATRWRPSRSSRRSLRRRGEALSRRSEPSSSTQREICSSTGASVRSIASAISRSSGASSRCSSSAARARRPPAMDAPIRPSGSTVSVPPRPACAAASRTSWIPCSGGSSAMSSSATASDGQGLPPPDLVRVARRRELACELGAVGRLSRSRQSLGDDGELKGNERVEVHAPECTTAGSSGGAGGAAQSRSPSRPSVPAASRPSSRRRRTARRGRVAWRAGRRRSAAPGARA